MGWSVRKLKRRIMYAREHAWISLKLFAIFSKREMKKYSERKQSMSESGSENQ